MAGLVVAALALAIGFADIAMADPAGNRLPEAALLGEEAAHSEDGIAGDAAQIPVTVLLESRDSSGSLSYEEEVWTLEDFVSSSGSVVGVVIPGQVDHPDLTSVFKGIQPQYSLIVVWSEIVDEDMLAGWTVDNHPFDTWSDEPGVPGLYIHVIMPLGYSEDGPWVQYEITMGFGEVDGQPAAWEVGIEPPIPGRSGPGIWHSGCVCCFSQLFICQVINAIPFIGPMLCPASHCVQCSIECCEDGSVLDSPCHSCGWCGGSQWLWHIVPGGSC